MTSEPAAAVALTVIPEPVEIYLQQVEHGPWRVCPEQLALAARVYLLLNH